jgi:hypothetical protein
LFTLGDEPLTLDASRSYDTWNDGSALAYSWTCENILYPDQLCFGSESANFLLNQAVIQVPSTALSLGSYAFTVTVSKGGYSDSATVRIDTNGNGPNVEILVDSLVNANELVMLEGFCEDPDATFTWTLLEGDINLSAEDCKSINESSKIITCTDSQSVVFNENALGTGSTYRLRLEATTTSGSLGWAEVSFEVNERPAGGCCTLSATAGDAYTDTFTVACSSWEDAHLPLQYEFFRITDEASDESPLQIAASTMSSAVFLLPPGSSQIIARITDTFGAFTEIIVGTIEASVADEFASLTHEERVAFLLESTSGASPDLIFNAMTIAVAELEANETVATKRQTDTTTAELVESITRILIELPSEESETTVTTRLSLLATLVSSAEISDETALLLLDYLSSVIESYTTFGISGAGSEAFMTIQEALLPVADFEQRLLLRENLEGLIPALVAQALPGVPPQSAGSEMELVWRKEYLREIPESMTVGTTEITFPSDLKSTLTEQGLSWTGLIAWSMPNSIFANSTSSNRAFAASTK